MKRVKLHKKVEQKTLLFLAILLTAWQETAYSQSSGGAGAITAATTEVSSFYDPAKKFIWALSAVLGLVGAVKLYYKFTNNDPESSKHAVGFLGGGIALFVAEVFLRKMFMS